MKSILFTFCGFLVYSASACIDSSNAILPADRHLGASIQGSSPTTNTVRGVLNGVLDLADQ